MNLTPWEEYQRGLPKKRMGVGVIFFDSRGRVLLVKHSYKEGWSVPGGTCGEDESPKQTGEREVEEEIGLKVKLRQLLAVSYNFARDKYTENLQWWFYGGVLSKKQQDEIKLDGEELIDYRFSDLRQVKELGKKNIARLMPTLQTAIKNRMAVYLENWQEL